MGQSQTEYISEKQYDVLKNNVKVAGSYSMVVGIFGLILSLILSGFSGTISTGLIAFVFYMVIYISLGYRVSRLKYKTTFFELMFLMLFSIFLIVFAQVKIGILFIVMLIWLFRGAKAAYTLNKIKEFQSSLE